MNYKLLLNKALHLAKSQQFKSALEILEQLKAQQEVAEVALKLSVKIAFSIQKYDLAKSDLKKLLLLVPNNFDYLSALVDIYNSEKNTNEICNCYFNFLKNNPKHALANFNYAYYSKKNGEFESALTFYHKSIELNISDSHEVYLNMAVIYSDHYRDDIKAKTYLQKAIEIKPNYSGALYNLANIYEQEGDRSSAVSFFTKAYDIDKTKTDALARLIDIKKFVTGNEIEIKDAIKALKSKTLENNERCNLYYALGKAYNDCKDYNNAFVHYKQANNLDKKMLPLYEQQKQTEYINRIIRSFTESVEGSHSALNGQPPIFICGMFRSGSTLIEQILSAHPDITAGGELEFFPRLINQYADKFPENSCDLKNEELKEIAEQYLNEISLAFSTKGLITDKRPDNFLYVGFIKKIFPNAKFIFTQRNMLDNCLSVNFLRLGPSMNYATSLTDTLHFYNEQKRLLEHWKKLFNDDIYVFDYDTLIESPKLSVTNLLNFLGLSWDESCESFYSVNNSVKTASVWQVRQPLYKSSSGRWKNYAEQINALNIKCM